MRVSAAHASRVLRTTVWGNDIPFARPGLGRDGGMAEYLLVDQTRQLVPLGDLDPVAAAPLLDAALTPYHAIRRRLGRLRFGSPGHDDRAP